MNLCELASICSADERSIFAIICIAVFVIGLAVCEDPENH